uniref:Uncharacterized protein n=2 Tax=Trichogramma kaykai TaxID=54128 RepID=A0ABD2VSA4_9HYME
MIGRADIEGSKSDVAMNAWPPQASYPCVSMRTEHRDQASFCPFALREVSVLAELALGHLRYSLTDVPPQSNSPPGSVLESDHAGVQLANGRGRTPLLHAWLKNTVTAGIWIPGARVPPNRRKPQPGERARKNRITALADNSFSRRPTRPTEPPGGQRDVTSGDLGEAELRLT